MAGPFTFDDLIEALANAVIEAQDRIERYQIDSLKSYLDDDNRPHSLDLRVPSLRLDAEPKDGESFAEDAISVPLLALVKRSHLTIKDLEVDFEVDLVDLGSPAQTSEEQTEKKSPCRSTCTPGAFERKERRPVSSCASKGRSPAKAQHASWMN